MIKNTDDLRIKEIKELLPPVVHLYSLSINKEVSDLICKTRQDISNIIHFKDDRMLVIAGPCSIHDVDAALEYANRILDLKKKFDKKLLIVMRVYFEKPRTTIGWKGLVNDPNLDGSFDINKGLLIARKLLLDINNLGVPAGTEFLDMITPQYYADLISWGAIGARTTESQIHRELASGLSCPVGFKNGTDGNLQIAIDAVGSANHSHHFLSVTKNGHSAIVNTTGNNDCHVILRGGKEPNYHSSVVKQLSLELKKYNYPSKIMIDLSHSNSNKDYRQQKNVAIQIAQQLKDGEKNILGVMIESNLIAGKQVLSKDKPLVYGQSITDACIDLQETEEILAMLADI